MWLAGAGTRCAQRGNNYGDLGPHARIGPVLLPLLPMQAAVAPSKALALLQRQDYLPLQIVGGGYRLVTDGSQCSQAVAGW